MYQVTVKGRTIEELKKAVADIHDELSGSLVTIHSASITKDLDFGKGPGTEALNVTTEEDEFVDESQIGLGINTSAGMIAGIELDSESIPWDARIHSSSREKIANGTWKIRRGTDKDLVNKVKTELRGSAVRSPAPELTVTQVPHVEVPPTQPLHIVQQGGSSVRPDALVNQPAVHQAPATTVAQPQSMAAPTPPMPKVGYGHTVDSFKAQFPLILSQLITEEKVDQTYVNQLKDFFKVDQIWNVSDEQKAMIFDSFVEYGLIQKVG